MLATDDWTLVAAWRDGDKHAGNQIITRYFGLLSRFFRNKVANPADAEDLLAETLLACTIAKARASARGSFRSYLFAIAMNTLREHYRKQSKRARERDDFAELCAADLGPGTMSSLVQHRRELKLLILGLRAIPLEYQIVLELKLFEGLGGPEIAALLEVPQATVYSRVRLGRQRLRRAVAALAETPRELESTVSNIEGWAREIQLQLAPLR
ncbi:MAG: sigma-70 family RNA polymerase sigma factor [Myxococcales bacterium]|nr:sigma-70 family RNA polymerase sigma factor [Myxococcales bacterium]